MSPIAQWRCQDIDEQSEALPGWEQEYYQLTCGKFEGQVATARSSKVTLIRETTNQGLHESVVAPQGQVVFAFALNAEPNLYVDRKRLDSQSLLVMEGGCSYDFRTTGFVELFGLAVDTDFLAEHTQFKNPELLKNARREKVLTLEAVTGNTLRNYWTMMSKTLQSGQPYWPDDTPLEIVAKNALDNIWGALNAVDPDRRKLESDGASDRQDRIVKRAIHFMRSNINAEFSITDVCAVTHVSQRTLQYHFEKSLHISPQQYLKALRLNLAHRMIREINFAAKSKAQTKNIGDIAAHCGYQHSSRFAGDYKRLFGELPSESMMNILQNSDFHGLM